MRRAALIVAALAIAACEGTVLVEDDEGPSPPGALFCPLEDDACSAASGVPAPVIVEVDAGLGSGGGAP